MEEPANVFLKLALDSLTSDASFSSCGLYRWSLRRKWSESSLTLLFIGLNPSIADKINNDHTLNRLLKFSKNWGYGSLVVVNLFAKISRSPRGLRNCVDPVGSHNDDELACYFRQWSQTPFWDVCFGWGDGGTFLKRDVEVMYLFNEYFSQREKYFPKASGPLMFGLTKNGNPRHPLYLSKKEQLKAIEFRDLFKSLHPLNP